MPPIKMLILWEPVKAIEANLCRHLLERDYSIMEHDHVNSPEKKCIYIYTQYKLEKCLARYPRIQLDGLKCHVSSTR